MKSNVREPVFGSGAGPFVAQLFRLALALGLILSVLLIAVFVKDQTRSLLYGEHPKLEIDQSTVIDGVKIKRIN